MALQALSFKTSDIEDAMSNTLLQGGDLHSALDWLCLNLSDGEQRAGRGRAAGDREMLSVSNAACELSAITMMFASSF